MKNLTENFIPGFIRFVTYLICFFFLSIFITGMIGFFYYKPSGTTVFPKDVQVTFWEARNLPPITLPQEIEKYFQYENRDILEEWLVGLEDDEIRDFISNLAVVIGEAEKKKLEIVPVINQYKNLKLQKLKKTYLERWIEKESKLFFLILSGVSLLFFLFFGTILMIGSIEKQIRNSQFII